MGTNHLLGPLAPKEIPMVFIHPTPSFFVKEVLINAFENAGKRWCGSLPHHDQCLDGRTLG